MARERIYANSAERQKAYRERAALHRAHSSAPPTPKKSRQPSRPKRLAAVERELRTLTAEYESWLDNLPEFLEGSDLSELLSQAIEQLTDMADLIADITLPRGFGRD